MADSPRIEELRRRVQKDPASMVFAQLAEEYLRAERHDEAVRVAEAGLQRHPGYLSARVVLGRALIGLGRYDEGQAHLEQVVKAAPENLAAIRGLAELHQHRSDPDDTESRRQEPPTDLPADPAPEAAVTADLDLTLRPEVSAQAELNVATSGFARALEALDGASFDLPAYDPPLNERPTNNLREDDASPVADFADVPDAGGEWDLPELERESAAANESDREAEALAELEEWLTALVADGRARTREPR